MTQDLLSGVWTASQAPDFSSRGWELLVAQASATRLSARLALHFKSRGWDAVIPERAWQQLQNTLRYDRVLQRDVMQEIRHLARALAEVDTPVVLLKGAAYLAGGLPMAHGRLFSDIDILVRSDKLRDVELALLAAGWVAEKLQPYDDRYYREWMHELPPLRHVQRHTYLDVHHTLAPPTSRFVIDGADMLARSQAIRIDAGDAAQMRILAPTDLVLHSALHMMQEGEFHSGLRDLLDIRDLLLHYGQDSDFWPALGLRARALGLDDVMAQVLWQLQLLFGFNPPADWPWPPQTRRRALVQKMLSRVLAPPAVGAEDMFTRSARLAMYVRSHWLRMPWYQIVPHISRKAWARLTHRTDAHTT
jgi:hypothetical protein